MGNLILNGIGMVIWYSFVAPILFLINSFEKIFMFLIRDLIVWVLFKDKSLTISNVPEQFWYFIGFAFAIGIAAFFINLIHGYFHSGERLKINFFNSLKMSAKSIFWILLIPIILVALMFCYRGLVDALKLIFPQNNPGNDSKKTLADIVFRIAYIGESYKNEKGEWIGPNGFDGNNPITTYPRNWILGREWNPIISILSVWLTMYFFFRLCSTIFSNYLWVWFLAIVAPLPAIWQIRDQGEKLNDWKNALFSKIFGLIGNFLAFCFFSLFLETLIDIVKHPNAPEIIKNKYNNILIQIGFLTAIVFSATKISSWFGELFVISNSSLNLESSEGSKAITSTIARGTGKMVARSAATLKSASASAATGIAATGILGKTAKQFGRKKISNKWTSSKTANRLNSFRNLKSQALNSAAMKSAKKVDKLNAKVLKTTNPKKTNKLNKKVARYDNKFTKQLNKSEKLKQKVDDFKKKKKN